MNFNHKLDKAIAESMTDILSESQLKAIGRSFIRSSDVEKLLSNHGIKHMIIGAHALGEITSEPRATQDVDIIVRGNDFSKTIKLITDTFPNTHAEDSRIKDEQGNVLVDILTDDHPIYKMALNLGGRIPTPESLLVMKFLASVHPLRRKDKKLQDKADFFNIVSKVKIDTNKILDYLKQADSPIEYELHKKQILDWIEDAKI
jgi:hypothetical protein